MPAPIIWRLGITGENEVRDGLRQVGSAMSDGKVKGTAYAGSLRAQAREARYVINEERYHRQILLAKHPALLQTTRAISSMSAVLRTAAAAQILMNTAMLLSKGADAGIIENKNRMAQIQRELGKLDANRIEDQPKINELQEEYNRLSVDTEEKLKSQNAEWASNAIGIGLTGGHIASIVTGSPKALTALAKIGGRFRGIGRAATAAALGIGGVGSGLVGSLLTIGGPAVIGGLGKAYGEISSITTLFDAAFGTGFKKMFDDNIAQLLSGELPGFIELSAIAFEELGRRIKVAIGGAGKMMEESFKATFNWIVGGIEWVINGALTAIRKAINAANNFPLAKLLGIKISTKGLENIKIPRMGESAGRSLTSSGGGAAQGTGGGAPSNSGVTINVNFNGMTTDEAVEKTKKVLDEEARKLGWR